MSAFSRLFLQRVPKATRLGVALGGASAAVLFSRKQEQSKIAYTYCESSSPRYMYNSLNKASLEQLTSTGWAFCNVEKQENCWPGETEIDVTRASKETIGRLMLEDQAQKLVQQRDLLAQVVKKWNDPAYGEWMDEHDVNASELGQLWQDFNVIIECRASKAMMTRDLSRVQGDELSNKDALMLTQLVGLASQCKGAICRIGELIGKDEIEANEKLQIQSDLHFLRMSTKAIVPWLCLYETMVQEDLDWMYRECLKLEQVQQETFAKLAKQRAEQDKIKWIEGGKRLKTNKESFELEKLLKKSPLPRPGRASGESSSVSVRRSQ